MLGLQSTFYVFSFCSGIEYADDLKEDAKEGPNEDPKEDPKEDP